MRFSAVFIKETISIVRDKRALFMTLIFPIFMLILYSFGVNFDLEDVPIAVLDYNHSADSRDLIHKLNSSRYIDVIEHVDDYGHIEELLIRSKIILAIIFPRDFEESIKRGRKATIQVIANGSDANTTSMAMGYLNAILASYANDLVEVNLAAAGLKNKPVPRVVERTRLWYNTELKSTYFVTPGVIAVVSMLLGALLTATSIVREKETGTIEMLVSTPIKPLELVFGKMTPYLIISFFDVILVIVVAHFGLKVPIKGSIISLLFGSILYLFCALAIGLLASSLTNTVSASQFIVTFTCFLPTILLSGFIFPIESMPKVIQLITYVFPGRYFLVVLRGIFLKGVGLGILWPQYLFMFIFGSVIMILAAAKFKKRLD